MKNKLLWSGMILSIVIASMAYSLLRTSSIEEEEVKETSLVEADLKDLQEDVQEEIEEEIQEVPDINDLGTINVEYHSVDEILTLYYKMELDETVGIIFSMEPDLNNLTSSGELHSATQEEALNTLNFARYIAGVSYDVSINPDYVQNSQDAALALAALGGGPDHYIEQPSGMSDALFASACLGTLKGNLSAGINSLTTNIIHGWLSDEGDNNAYTLGHRRMALDPTLMETGFGLVYADESAKYNVYSAMSVQGVTLGGDVAEVAWPAQTMPVEYFYSNYPWSFSTGTILSGSTQVTIVRENDGATWTMIDDFLYGQSGDGFLTINNDYYGQTGCIIFEPEHITYSAGDIYHVSISGSYEADYTVTFFSLNDDYSNVSSVEYREAMNEEIVIEEPEEIVDISGASKQIQEELQSAVEDGFPVGIYASKFQETITRGEFAHMLGLFCENKWAITGDYSSTSFTDLGSDTKDEQRNKYIVVLNQWGVLHGITATTFCPDEIITYEEVATILLAVKNLYLNVSISQDISSYQDANLVSNEHLDGVRYMNQIGVLLPDSKNCLNPLDCVTVEDAAVMCYRFFR